MSSAAESESPSPEPEKIIINGLLGLNYIDFLNDYVNQHQHFGRVLRSLTASYTRIVGGSRTSIINMPISGSQNNPDRTVREAMRLSHQAEKRPPNAVVITFMARYEIPNNVDNFHLTWFASA